MQAGVDTTDNRLVYQLGVSGVTTGGVSQDYLSKIFAIGHIR